MWFIGRAAWCMKLFKIINWKNFLTTSIGYKKIIPSDAIWCRHRVVYKLYYWSATMRFLYCFNLDQLKIHRECNTVSCRELPVSQFSRDFWKKHGCNQKNGRQITYSAILNSGRIFALLQELRTLISCSSSRAPRGMIMFGSI